MENNNAIKQVKFVVCNNNDKDKTEVGSIIFTKDTKEIYVKMEDSNNDK